jgi:hypothetical protein
MCLYIGFESSRRERRYGTLFCSKEGWREREKSKVAGIRLGKDACCIERKQHVVEDRNEQPSKNVETVM